MVAAALVYLSCVITTINGPKGIDLSLDEANQQVTMVFAPTRDFPQRTYRLPASFSARTVDFVLDMYGNKTYYEVSRIDLSFTEDHNAGIPPNPGKCSLQKAEQRAF
ncbi:hypothetical protein [Azospirillum picis]|uniref:Uncharacterized protein n=1 Tax=Azospirillum picis TaxID=488438 RepID=A0ABU0MUI1_9PROT|nr:hypothetical protein [Azospirillum picis]MBP2302979.1 hypothetical protein [Azospirillum picis]MDQ0536731.1 hypothetical protein [Azospirillum picis]